MHDAQIEQELKDNPPPEEGEEEKPPTPAKADRGSASKRKSAGKGYDLFNVFLYRLCQN